VSKWIVLGALVFVSACGRKPAPGTSLTGAAAPRLAVEQFMAAVKAQDLQAMSVVWGTAKGPARDQLERTELEKREIIMQGCYDHDSFRVLEEGPAPDGERAVRVEVTRARKTATPTFLMVKGPSDRWYVRDAGINAMREFCRR
jgi:hypothetical protein